MQGIGTVAAMEHHPGHFKILLGGVLSRSKRSRQRLYQEDRNTFALHEEEDGEQYGTALSSNLRRRWPISNIWLLQ
jgi:hypothetical protein